MLSLFPLTVCVFPYASALVLPALLYPQAPLAEPEAHPLLSAPQSTLQTWLEREEEVAVDRLLANMAPAGRNALDAAPGTVLASPSRSHPNYYYQWVRDAGITMSTVIDLYNSDPTSDLSVHSLLPTLQAYATLQREIQRTPNPSGDFSFPDLAGLGEPKFEVDGSAFTDNWGRPQRDGPALRATALMAFLRAYNTTHPGLWEARTEVDGVGDWFGQLYSAELPARSTIKADLEYVARHWPASGFDLWEEVQGRHFFTGMTQLRALREGAELATLFNDQGAADYYGQQAGKLESGILRDFWDEKGGYLRATRGGEAEWQRSGMDCSVLLGSLHGNAQEPTYPQSPIFPPHDGAVLSSLLRLVADQRDRFPINSRPAQENENPLRGVGVGRYPEDVYDGYGAAGPGGGNPWFLCTSSVAEVLYRTAEHLNQAARLDVSDRGFPFWHALICEGSSSSSSPDHCPLERKSYHHGGNGSDLFETALKRLRDLGDEFLAVVKRHARGDGALSEQFDRWTGFERGARDLTWSYGAFLQAVWARQRAGQGVQD